MSRLLREFVAKDRAEAAARGVPPPRIYWIGQNDKYDAAPHKLAYLDLAFFRTAQGLFDEAAVPVAPGSLAARRVQRERFKMDGAYHLYRIGRVTIREGSAPGAPSGTTVWALEGRRLGACVDRVYVPDAADPEANMWDAYISPKVDGPAYVKGSTAPNGVWMDRVLLVKPQPTTP